MNFYQIKSKIIYRRYRLVMKIIYSFKYCNSIQFIANMLLLLHCVSDYNYMCYGNYECLSKLIDYYEIQCIDIMYIRAKLEFDKKRGVLK